MPRLYLVRHGHAAASWTEHLDPGLDDVGTAEAEAVGMHLASVVDPALIRSSPLLRTQQTARPLAERWSCTVLLDPSYGEVPSPSTDPAERRAWLSAALVAHWSDLGDAVTLWRSRLLEAAASTAEHTVVFTHFVAINAVVGAAMGRPEVITFAPANGSVTEIEVDSDTGSLEIVRLGSEATPEVG